VCEDGNDMRALDTSNPGFSLGVQQ
jgi:hypothetical protein